MPAWRDAVPSARKTRKRVRRQAFCRTRGDTRNSIETTVAGQTDPSIHPLLKTLEFLLGISQHGIVQGAATRLGKISVCLLEADTPGTRCYRRRCAGVFAEPKGRVGWNGGARRSGRAAAAHGRAPGALLFAPASNSLVKSFKLWHTDDQWESGETATAGGLHACP